MAYNKFRILIVPDLRYGTASIWWHRYSTPRVGRIFITNEASGFQADFSYFQCFRPSHLSVSWQSELTLNTVQSIKSASAVADHNKRRLIYHLPNIPVSVPLSQSPFSQQYLMRCVRKVNFFLQGFHLPMNAMLPLILRSVASNRRGSLFLLWPGMRQFFAEIVLERQLRITWYGHLTQQESMTWQGFLLSVFKLEKNCGLNWA